MKSLQDLCDFLNAESQDNGDEYANFLYSMRAVELGLPIKHGWVDTAHLPTFGGQEPDDTAGIFSWDENSFLIQKSEGWRLVARNEFGRNK